MASAAAVYTGTNYPERDEPRESRLERLATAVHYFTGGVRTGLGSLEPIVVATDRAAKGLSDLSQDALRELAPHTALSERAVQREHRQWALLARLPLAVELAEGGGSQLAFAPDTLVGLRIHHLG